ncbi:PD-(D/E)XK nuclease-like domain-containing protein [Mycobacterium yunnanensis]|uniref:PD-(D/E)XK nuclease-like domain-containing protein n=1 Tax=Mycobacterium yunnanensis TaxID=368477 RepID=A0A9X2ZBH1_9MYCO|nr:PD-(D/E)XK nuclease-like domain-containing protein [Mycobacterium yunnanensis]MCV7424382.1 PD-(D/E)XK nuclease-like domain-containing protein [Mycobacterium yunnanensis]
MTARPDGVVYNLADDEYHADRSSLSVSGAKLLLPPSCPAKFREYMDNPRKPKREWDFGHVAHRIVLGKGAEFSVLNPAVHGLKKDGTVADSPRATAGWKAADADARAAGLVPIHVDDATAAEEMAQRVLQHPSAGPLFADGEAEVSMYATDAETGVQLRGRCDWIEPDGDIDDYKTSTTANPAELERKFFTLGYFMQAAWYIDLAVATGRAANPAFRFVVQEKVAPFVVTVVQYDDDAIAEGRRRNRQAIRMYAEMQESGRWPGYSDGVVTISLPGWVLRDGEQAQIRAQADELINELEGIYQA